MKVGRWLCIGVVPPLLITVLFVGWQRSQTERRATVMAEQELSRRESELKANSEDSRAIDNSLAEDKEKFAEFCLQVRSRNMEMGDRMQQLIHTEMRSERETNLDGSTLGSQTKTETVWFDNGEEKRQLVRKESAGRIIGLPAAKFIYPLSRHAGLEDYNCTFDGFEVINHRLTVRIRCDAVKPIKGKLSGWLWADRKTAEPVRFEGLAVKPPAFVERLHQIAEYTTETATGENQLLSTKVEVTIPIMRKVRHIEVNFNDYRPQRLSMKKDDRRAG